MKILMIQQPSSWEVTEPPLGLAHVTAYLRQKGHDTTFIDLQVDNKEIKKYVMHNEAVGMSCMTSNFPAALKLANEIKKINPAIPIIFGGVHPTVMPKQTLKNQVVDYVVMGEGEHTTLDLINTLENSNDLSKVKGIAYKDQQNIIINEPRPPIQNLDELPNQHEIYDVMAYAKRRAKGYGELVGQIIVSRGCPFNCFFCAVKATWGVSYRAKSPKAAVDEMEWLADNFGIHLLSFDDASINSNRKWVMQFCDEIIERGLNDKTKWLCNVYIGRIDEELISKMQQAGCSRMFFGVESGSSEILKILRKKITVTDIIQTFNLVHKYGIKSQAYFMIGNPGETNEAIKETLVLAKKIQVDKYSWNICTPLPGSDLWIYSLKKGYVTNDMNFEEITFHNPLILDNLTAKEIKDWYYTAKAMYPFKKISLNDAIKYVLNIRKLDDLKYPTCIITTKLKSIFSKTKDPD